VSAVRLSVDPKLAGLRDLGRGWPGSLRGTPVRFVP
jgi:hypothetical protein